jgi:DNA repair exonuclease SbcCD ATPase subunit
MCRVQRIFMVILALGLARGFSQTPALAQSDRKGDFKSPPRNISKDGLQAIFEAGWPRSLKAQQQARQQYDRQKVLAAKDWRLHYAYALVQLRQLRYPDALKAINEVLALDKNNLTAWQIKIWLLALTGEDKDALSEMERLGDSLPREEAAAEAEARYAGVAGFLGGLCGYLEGPGREGVDELLAVKCRQRISDRLTTSRRGPFEEARRSVAAQFSTAAKEIDEKSAAAEAQAAKEKDRVLEELQSKAEKLAAEMATAEQRNEKLKKDLDYELEQITSRERTVLAEAQTLEAQAIPLREEVRILDGRIAHLLEAADREKDQFERQRLLNDAARWRLHRNRVLATLDDLNRRYATLNSERLALQQRRQNAVARYQKEAARLDTLRRSLERTRAEQAKAAGKTVTGNSPAVRDQKRRAAALTTYVPLPVSLEDERDRLLESAN